MTDDRSSPRKLASNLRHGLIEDSLTVVFKRISFKAGLAFFVSAGLVLFFLSQFNYLFIHTILEVLCIVLLTAIFLIGWNTRHLVKNQFFLVLAIGFLLTGFVDLLHTLSYKGMNILPVYGADKATQLWLVGRIISTAALLSAIGSLGKKEILSGKQWFMIFICFTAGFLLSIWPLKIFPVCYVEGVGLTPFKVYSEYLIIAMMVLAGFSLYHKREYLNDQLIQWLLVSIGLSVASEFMFTLYKDVYGIFNYLGHYFKFSSVLMVYFALVEATLRSPFATLFREMGQSYEELNQELKKRHQLEKQQEMINRDNAILYQTSRVMHSTLNLDDLAHLMLSIAASVELGQFERATLFTVNRRTRVVQGMLGVAQDTASLVTGEMITAGSWTCPQISEAAREAQRASSFNQRMIKQRFPLDDTDNPLVKAILSQQLIVLNDPGKGFFSENFDDEGQGLGPFACVPCAGSEQFMGVLLVDNSLTGQVINAQKRRFLELFSNLAGSALDNASLVKRLEMAHENLQKIQEQLIHGEKMAVLGEMAAQVAHELRNPLVSIGGFAQRLSRTDLKDAKAHDYATIIAREVRRMEELLNNILSFSKKQLVCFETCQINEILKEIADLEYDQCLKQEIRLVNNTRTDLPEIAGDYRQLRQVFLNLFINARQAIGRGGTITIEAKPSTLRNEPAVKVDIEDTGGGMPPEVIRNMFNPFFSTSAKGTGLGLTISHRIVAHHHGEIQVANIKHGACFTVLLPVQQKSHMDFQA